jgi:hypothetical protein
MGLGHVPGRGRTTTNYTRLEVLAACKGLEKYFAEKDSHYYTVALII